MVPVLNQHGITKTMRKLDPARTFDRLVGWIKDQSRDTGAPGLIVGLSGTDSILTFLACARAFDELGRPDRVLGVHFQHDHPIAGADDAPITCATDFNWVADHVIPWLRVEAPAARIEIDTSLPVSDDNLRWGKLLSRAVADTGLRRDLRDKHYFPVGTRNATEEALGSYSQASKAVSMLPLVDIFKTEVLAICDYLGVPEVAIEKSREVDCDCGRFEVQAEHMREIDLYLMLQQKLLSPQQLALNMSQATMVKVAQFCQREIAANAFRHKTPYRPEVSLVQC